MSVNIREFHFPDDYANVLKLWESIETGMNVGPSDTLDEIQKKLQRDPDLFLLTELNDEIIGVVIGGYDGRREMIYHLAVHHSVREQGIGAALLNDVEKRLQAKDCLKCYLLVVADNDHAIQFYQNRSWHELKDTRVFRKEF